MFDITLSCRISMPTNAGLRGQYRPLKRTRPMALHQGNVEKVVYSSAFSALYDIPPKQRCTKANRLYPKMTKGSLRLGCCRPESVLLSRKKPPQLMAHLMALGDEIRPRLCPFAELWKENLMQLRAWSHSFPFQRHCNLLKRVPSQGPAEEKLHC